MRGGFAKRGTYSVALRLANMGLGFILAILLARFLGVKGYGEYSFVFAIVSMLAIPAQFGLPALLVRETAKGKSLNQLAYVKSLWLWAARLGVGLSSLCSLIFFLCFIAFQYVSDWPTNNGLSLSLMVWASLLLPILGLGALRGGALRGLGLVIWGQLPEDIIRPALFSVMIVVFVLVAKFSLSPALAMMLQTLAAVCSFAFGAMILFWATPHALQKTSPARTDSVLWVRSAWPLMISASSHIVNRYADIIILGVLSTMSDAGVYRVAAQAAMLVRFGLQGLNMVVAPTAASHYASGNMKGLQFIARFTSGFSLLLALPPALIFLLYGEFFLEWIFGSGFSNAYWPLLILITGQLVNASVGPVGLFLSMCGHERVVAKTLILAVGLNVTLNILLIPLYGIMGAACATSISMSIWNLYLSRQVRETLGIETVFFLTQRSKHSR
jgi:O-antigen/teichoic acid export membrane protein